MQHRIELVVAAALRAGIRAALAIVAVEHLTEHEERILAARGGVRVQRGRPGVPERQVDVLHGVDPEPVAIGVVDQPLGRELQLVLHDGIFGREVVEPEQLAQDLFGIDEVADVAVGVELREIVEHAGVTLGGVVPA